MKSFLLVAQAAAAEADEQKRFCPGAVPVPGVGSLVVIIISDGSIINLGKVPGTVFPRLISVETRRGPVETVKEELVLEVGNRRVMLSANVLKGRAAAILLLLSQKSGLGSVKETLGDLLRSLQRHF